MRLSLLILSILSISINCYAFNLSCFSTFVKSDSTVTNSMPMQLNVASETVFSSSHDGVDFLAKYNKVDNFIDVTITINGQKMFATILGPQTTGETVGASTLISSDDGAGVSCVAH